MVVGFTLAGQRFTALNGGPQFAFTPAVSFVVDCTTQEEVDHYWDKLSEGGDPEARQCGWLKDRFGLSWQIVPVQLAEYMSDPDPEKAGRHDAGDAEDEEAGHRRAQGGARRHCLVTTGRLDAPSCGAASSGV